MTVYQIVTPLLSLLAILYAWNLVMRQKKTIWEALLWTLFWGAIAAIAIFLPEHAAGGAGTASDAADPEDCIKAGG